MRRYGICGISREREVETREYLRNLPMTVLFADGNHENFAALNSYPVEEWNGGKVHIIEPGIIHLMRGQVYLIDGKKFFVFGGAYSMDRPWRTLGSTWFEEELPSEEEYEEALEQARFFQQIADKINFKDWYFGHLHEDYDIVNFHCRLDEVTQIE
jgi:hypothetical protein